MRELRERGYEGGYTILTDWLRPQRQEARAVAERLGLQPVAGRPPYPYAEEELRKVARDGFVNWQGSRYSVPWVYAGKEVWVRGRGGSVEIHYGGRRIAGHAEAARRHLVVCDPAHHEGIAPGARQPRQTLVDIRRQAPVVEARPLEAYESLARGGGR